MFFLYNFLNISHTLRARKCMAYALENKNKSPRASRNGFNRCCPVNARDAITLH